MGKTRQEQTGLTRSQRLSKEMNMEITLETYLSLQGIDLPLDAEDKDSLRGDFLEWAEEIDNLPSQQET